MTKFILWHSNKNGLAVVFIATKRTCYSLQWYKKTLWIYYFSFFPFSVGFLVDFICQTYREDKFWVKDAKNAKSQFFNLDLVHFSIPMTKCTAHNLNSHDLFFPRNTEEAHRDQSILLVFLLYLKRKQSNLQK